MSNTPLLHVTATEFAKRYARYRVAAQRAPVAITHHETVTEVLISKHDFDEYQRLKAQATKAYRADEIPADLLEALAASRMDPRHDALNSLMDDDRE